MEPIGPPVVPVLVKIGTEAIRILRGGPGGWRPPASAAEAARRIEGLESRTPADAKKARQYEQGIRALERYSLANFGVAPGTTTPPAGGNWPVAQPPAGPGPGTTPVEPTTDVTAILKKIPLNVARLAEFLRAYRWYLAAALYMQLEAILNDYNRAVELDEKSKADAAREANDAIKAARDAALKEGREAREARREAREARREAEIDAERRAEEAARKQRARDVAEIGPDLDKTAAEIATTIRREKQRGRELEIARKAAAKRARQRAGMPAPPVPVPRRVQILGALLKGALAVQEIRAQRRRSAPVVVLPGANGPVSVPDYSGDLLTGFQPGALDSQFADTGTSTDTEVCSCRPRYPRRRRKKTGERRICYTRKVKT